MILKELFDTAVPFQLSANGSGQFNVNGKAYAIDFQSDGAGTVEMSFALRQGEHINTMPKYVDHVSGTGDEFVVFSTVIAATKQYISNHPTRKLVFSSKTNEPSRVKLYDRIVSSVMRGWHLTTYQEDKYTVYELLNPNIDDTSSPEGAGSREDVPF